MDARAAAEAQSSVHGIQEASSPGIVSVGLPTVSNEPTARLLRNMCAGNPTATTGESVSLTMARPVAQNEELRWETQSESIPDPKVDRPLPTFDLPSYLGEDIRKHKNHILDTQFERFPTPSTFQCWKTTSKTDVCYGSNYPSEAIRWINEVEMATSVDDVKTSRSVS